MRGRRVAVVGAAFTAPVLLMLDEPSAGMAAAQRRPRARSRPFDRSAPTRGPLGDHRATSLGADDRVMCAG